LESLTEGNDEDFAGVDRARWAQAAQSMLKEMPTARDRDLLVRFYLNDESKEAICASLGLSDEHFNRVIFRARNRFRALLERRGYVKLDLLSLFILVGVMCSAVALGSAPALVSKMVPEMRVPARAQTPGVLT
jgi:hypothetical protein